MISNHLNDVERRRQDANDLSAQIAQYLAAGGKIHEPEPAPIKSTSTSELKHPPSFHGKKVKEDTNKRVARIREMAKTLTRNEICEREGIALATLKAIASKHAIKFQVRQKIGTVPNKATPELEDRLVVQIKDCIAGGMNRSQCCKALAISYNMLDRIVRDHQIDYPTLKSAFR
jgi:DNA invertase Pin-like site-specific DNA recombinase